MRRSILLASLSVALFGASPPAAQPPQAPAPPAPATGDAAKAPAKDPAKDPARAHEPYEWITEKDIAAIDFEDLPPDQGFVSPVADNLDNLDDISRKRMEDIQAALDEWAPGYEKSVAQRVRNWMSLCCIPDLGRAEFEAELPYTIFQRLKAEVPADKLKKSLAWIVLRPNEGKVITKAAELDANDPIDEELIRERHVFYAKKLLGRLLGKLPPKE